jgi:hypothetical protein
MATYLAQTQRTRHLSAENWRNLHNFILCMCANSGHAGVDPAAAVRKTQKHRGAPRPGAPSGIALTSGVEVQPAKQLLASLPGIKS